MHRNSPTLTLIGWGSLVLQVGGCYDANHPSNVKNVLVKKPPKNKPWIWIDKIDKQLEQGNGINLGSWNVRTLNTPGALQYVLDTVRSYKIQLLALQEVRWPNKGSVTKENMTLFYSGTDNGAQENGVGIIVHDCLLPHVKIFEPVNDRICYILLKGKYFDIAVISCYGPTEEKEDEKKTNFMRN
ncbi:uncharacterized protein LOC103307682 [Acyrthosiphon pisum]|uniref:Craniofacial development protein 2-like n=1 Tax=Acyrthosiphon pisum TaxID=7029 RepID=A0A8R2B2U6_ACYPI|nr:uncharacterized protein LOC103307682 [Acyrthosiphon pisum]|eukprot:XP_008179495.1 PREDICTED: uncharacterized protein LOC103307682 [Acyrthosiphon pisum]